MDESADAMSGEVLRDGRYEIRGTLGAGSQGTTFRAVDLRTGQSVAIKRFVVKGAGSWKEVELAEREAKVLATLSHPALPRHLDHFEEAGALYLVMENIEGESLGSIAARNARLSVEDVKRFLADAANVLAYLHGRSPPVIHRDINPKNVIRRPDGSYAFVDFGAVRDRLKPDGGSTVVGTFGYMAPEQFQGRALPSTDVYAVGATALRMFTGVEPENQPHRGLAIDVKAALGAGFDAELTHLLERMLDPDPDRRASSIGALLEERRRSRGSRSVPGEGRGRVAWDDWEQYAGPAWQGLRDFEKHAGRDLRTAREMVHAARRAAREARKQARRSRSRRRGRPLHGPPLVVVLIALLVARIVVGSIVGVAVPLVLTVLSIFLGRPLREAAHRVREAGARATSAIGRAQGVLLHGTEPGGYETASRTRVEDPAPPPARQRVSLGDEVVDTAGTEVAEPDRDEPGDAVHASKKVR